MDYTRENYELLEMFFGFAPADTKNLKKQKVHTVLQDLKCTRYKKITFENCPALYHCLKDFHKLDPLNHSVTIGQAWGMLNSYEDEVHRRKKKQPHQDAIKKKKKHVSFQDSVPPTSKDSTVAAHLKKIMATSTLRPQNTAVQAVLAQVEDLDCDDQDTLPHQPPLDTPPLEIGLMQKFIQIMNKQ